MTRTTLTCAVLALAALCALAVSGCKPTTELGDTIVNITDPTAEAITLTTGGWNAFEAARYADALSLFRQAIQKNDTYADAYIGLGWTYLRLDSLAKSTHAFDVALSQNPSLLDAYAGRAFVSLALGRYDDAVDAVAAIEWRGATYYAFRHDARISMTDLLLVKARAYFLLRSYGSARNIVDQLDPDNGLDATSPTYIEDLAREIETLAARV